MDYSVEELPQDCIEAGAVGGNFVTRNARFRNAVCQHFNLNWISIGGNGNCFFVSVITALKATGTLAMSSDLSAHQLRLNLVEYFRLCSGSTQPLCERVIVEIEAEQNQPLLCSTHARIDGERLNGLVPGSTERYLDAVSNNGVWPQGLQQNSARVRTAAFPLSIMVIVTDVESVHSLTHCRWLCGHVLPQL
jgi:hypothetical protein